MQNTEASRQQNDGAHFTFYWFDQGNHNRNKLVERFFTNFSRDRIAVGTMHHITLLRFLLTRSVLGGTYRKTKEHPGDGFPLSCLCRDLELLTPQSYHARQTNTLETIPHCDFPSHFYEPNSVSY